MEAAVETRVRGKHTMAWLIAVGVGLGFLAHASAPVAAQEFYKDKTNLFKLDPAMIAKLRTILLE